MASGLKFEKAVTDRDIEKYIQNSFWHELRDYVFYFIKVMVVVTVVYIFMRTSVFDLIGVSGKSMYPNYNDKTSDDSIYIDLLTPKFSDYQRGDVVVLIAPPLCDAKKSFYIKRIIGLPGEQVALENGKVYIINEDNPSPGVELDETAYLNPKVQTFKNPTQDDGLRYEEKKLGKNEYYFLGDNRTGSTDSRICGTIKKDQILGKEFFRLNPQDKRALFKLPKYNIGNLN